MNRTWKPKPRQGWGLTNQPPSFTSKLNTHAPKAPRCHNMGAHLCKNWAFSSPPRVPCAGESRQESGGSSHCGSSLLLLEAGAGSRGHLGLNGQAWHPGLNPAPESHPPHVLPASSWAFHGHTLIQSRTRNSSCKHRGCCLSPSLLLRQNAQAWAGHSLQFWRVGSPTARHQQGRCPRRAAVCPKMAPFCCIQQGGRS